MSPILAAAIAGFFLGASLIIAIGAQNAFILRQGLLGPQVIGVGMDLFGPDGFNYSLALFFALYIALAAARIVAKPR